MRSLITSLALMFWVLGTTEATGQTLPTLDVPVTVSTPKPAPTSYWSSDSFVSRKDGQVAVESYKFGEWVKPFKLNLNIEFRAFAGVATTTAQQKAYGFEVVKTIPTIGHGSIIFGGYAATIGNAFKLGALVGVSWSN